MSKVCPFCGKPTTHAGWTTHEGTRDYSLCCGIPWEFIAHYDVYAGLPEPLRQVAIDTRKAEYAAMDERDRKNARRFAEVEAAYKERYAYLQLT